MRDGLPKPLLCEELTRGNQQQVEPGGPTVILQTSSSSHNFDVLLLCLNLKLSVIARDNSPAAKSRPLGGCLRALNSGRAIIIRNGEIIPMSSEFTPETERQRLQYLVPAPVTMFFMLCGVTSKLGAQEDIDAGGGCSFTSGIGPDSPAAVPALMGFVEIVRAKEDETPSSVRRGPLGGGKIDLVYGDEHFKQVKQHREKSQSGCHTGPNASEYDLIPQNLDLRIKRACCRSGEPTAEMLLDPQTACRELYSYNPKVGLWYIHAPVLDCMVRGHNAWGSVPGWWEGGKEPLDALPVLSSSLQPEAFADHASPLPETLFLTPESWGASEPTTFDVRIYDLSKYEHGADDVLILATDGLWDVLSNEEVAEAITQFLPNCDPDDPHRIQALPLRGLRAPFPACRCSAPLCATLLPACSVLVLCAAAPGAPRMWLTDERPGVRPQNVMLWGHMQVSYSSVVHFLFLRCSTLKIRPVGEQQCVQCCSYVLFPVPLEPRRVTVPPSYQERELLIKVIEMRVRRAEEDPLFSGNKGKERRRVMPSDGRTSTTYLTSTDYPGFLISDFPSPMMSQQDMTVFLFNIAIDVNFN
ncbi:hypothetical protein CB1_001749015 [Camelus ferus]|nr:hypothetical protein CB1_001749015 [Camelus ferus]